MQIKVWGARGSLPAPQPPEILQKNFLNMIDAFVTSGYKTKTDALHFLAQLPIQTTGGFGGNTLCIEVKSNQKQFIIDAGSGIRLLGYDLMRGPCNNGQGEVHIFFTHFHWDHLMGLPFFIPLFIPGNKIHVYAVQPELQDVFKILFKKPFFPVSLENLGASIIYHSLQPRKAFSFPPFQITPYLLDHPDPTWGYKIESGQKTFSHCVDTECIRTSRTELGADLPLYQNVDLMLFDAQYTLFETLEKVNWGHAAASIGLDLAMRDRIKKILFLHHDPASSDEKIALAENEARKYFKSQLKIARRTDHTLFIPEWAFAYEGMCIDL